MSAPACPDCGATLQSVDGPAFCPACVFGVLTEELPEPAPLDGELIAGRYRLEAQIGEGGFATVWRAWQVQPVEREVALKWLKAEAVSPQVLARFEGERAALARMNHPGVATVLDAGSHAGRPFFAVELVNGEPLTDLCRRESLDVRARCRLLIKVCEAVQHAHAKGVIHRDLKPANILAWEERGALRVKVIDFGVARALEEPLSDRAATAVRQLVGTPGYMSPEQAEPGSAGIDVRSDVYALGVVLYEVLGGRLPFTPGRRTKDGTAPEWPAEASVRKAPRPWQRDLLAIADRALAFTQAERYASAQALADDLQRVLDEQPVTARPQRGLYALGKLARRHRAVVALSLIALACLVAGLAASLVLYFRAESHARELRRAQARQDRQAAQRWKTERQYPGAMPVLARALESEPDAAAAADLLAQAAWGRFMRPLGAPLRLEPEWGSLLETALSTRALFALLSGPPNGSPLVVMWPERDEGLAAPQIFPVPPLAGKVTRLAAAASGNRVAVWGRNSQAWAFSPATGSWLPALWPDGGAAAFIDIKPNGESALVATEEGAVWKVAGLKAEPVARFAGRIRHFFVSSGSAQPFIVAAMEDGSVYRRSLNSTGDPVALFKMNAPVTALASARTGRTIIAGDAQGNITLSDGTAEGTLTLEGGAESGGVTALAYDPGFVHLYASYEHGAVRGWTVAGGKPYGLPGDMPERIVALNGSSGSEVLVAGAGGTLRLWHPPSGRMTPLLSPARDSKLSGTELLNAQESRYRTVLFSPGGRSLTVMDSTPRQAGRILMEPYGAKLLSWRDDFHIAGVDGRDKFQAWDTVTLRRQMTGECERCAPLAVRAGSDGSLTILARDGSILHHREGQPLRTICPAVQPAASFALGVFAATANCAALAVEGGSEVVLLRWSEDGKGAVSRVAAAAAVTALAISPAGIRAGCGDASGEVSFFNWDGTERVRSARHLGAVTAMAWGPENAAASAAADGSLILWESSRAEPRTEPLRLSGSAKLLAWSASGNRLAAAALNELTVIDAASGFTIGPPLPMPVMLSTLTLNPPGTLLAGTTHSERTEGASGEIMLWPLPPAEPVLAPWFLEFARVLSAQRLTDAGQPDAVPPPSRTQLEALIPPDDASPAAVLARWLTAPGRRPVTLHPWHSTTEEAYLELLRDWPSTRPLQRMKSLLLGRLRASRSE